MGVIFRVRDPMLSPTCMILYGGRGNVHVCTGSLERARNEKNVLRAYSFVVRMSCYIVCGTVRRGFCTLVLHWFSKNFISDNTVSRVPVDKQAGTIL